MPSYLFNCKRCKLEFEKNYSFQEFEEIVLPKLVPCIGCGKVNKVNQVFTPPNLNLNNTIGARADKNAKGMGGKIGEESAEKKEKINKKKPKLPWYGQLSKQKTKDIFGEKNEKIKKEKIQRYIQDGK